MKRLYRNLSDETKEKISQSMKNFHSNIKTTEQARSTASKLSSSLKRYWDTVPYKSDCDKNTHTTLQEYLRGGLSNTQ